MPRPDQARPVMDRIMEKVVVTNDCWLWTGSKTGRGNHKYGYVGVGSRTDGTRTSRPVHIVVYEHRRGKVPAGLELDHLCKNTLCCNPKHLQPVTHAENVRRGDLGARNRKKTHCLRNHPLSGDNCYVDNQGRRRCRACFSYYKEKRERGI